MIHAYTVKKKTKQNKNQGKGGGEEVCQRKSEVGHKI